MNKIKPSKQELQKYYWDEFQSVEDLTKKYNVTEVTINSWLKDEAIPRRLKSVNYQKRIISKTPIPYWNYSENHKHVYEHRLVAETDIIKRKLKKDEVVHHKDGNSLNNHILNLDVMTATSHARLHITSKDKFRPSWFLNHMLYAYLISNRSSCERLQVGCVITNFDLDQIYSFGLNGNAKELANECDGCEPGKCGCIHAENNALIKVGIRDKNKIMFVTHSPCMQCAKLILNSGFSWVYYGEPYRDTTPLSMLHYYGVKTCPYPINHDKWDGCALTPKLVDYYKL
jgi:dCMP deaminase